MIAQYGCQQSPNSEKVFSRGGWKLVISGTQGVVIIASCAHAHALDDAIERVNTDFPWTGEIDLHLSVSFVQCETC